ncbi:hypothetical protein [Limosilactobacillus oris]|uniref:hypothetical protein n=1 Tax=Limosilactobacillus oris TaxID=1632 RepID=UPI002236C191|nr:hypothetical protein [Limosilactobacillus oris]MCW4387860.1 hypothetical protein [Limosilactobacillus oris]
MDLTQVEPGQGWLKNINNNFYAISQEFSKASSRADIVFLDGWQKDTGGSNNWPSEIIKTPMANGKYDYELKLSAYKNATPNEYGKLLIMPEGYQMSANYLGNIPTQYGGHTGGYIQLFAVANRIEYHFVPNNGGVDGEANNAHQIELHTSITWFA